MKSPVRENKSWPLPPIGVGARAAELMGLWSRELLAWYGADENDTTTIVEWLQAGDWYVDIRLDPDRPDFTAVHGLEDLERHHIAWLMAQEGFAGRLTDHGDHRSTFTWERAIDWAPTPGLSDSGTLHFEGDLLVERGVELPYLEHWRHRGPAGSTAWAVAREPDSGALCALVRAANSFGYARGRKVAIDALPSGERLAQSPLSDLRSLLDCEISMGEITEATWTVKRSVLPFLENQPPRCSFTGTAIEIEGAEPGVIESWPLVQSGGNLNLLYRQSDSSQRSDIHSSNIRELT